MKKTAVAAALTALAVPSAAVADHREPTDRGHGNDRSEQDRGDSQRQNQNRSRHQNRNRRGKQSVGFSLSGTGLSGLSGSTLALPLTLDVTSANRHARRLLELTRADIQGSGTETFGASSDTFLLRFAGITDGNNDGTVDLADVLATDRVKVIGKVTRTRTRDEDGDRTTSYGGLNIRKIVISRASAEDNS